MLREEKKLIMGKNRMENTLNLVFSLEIRMQKPPQAEAKENERGLQKKSSKTGIIAFFLDCQCLSVLVSENG